MNRKPLLFSICLGTLLSACDEVIPPAYITKPEADFFTTVFWEPDSVNPCRLISEDTNIVFNNVQLLFYKDNSTINSFPREIYDLDSTLVTSHHFELTQDDSRVEENDSILVIFIKGKKKVKTQVLHKDGLWNMQLRVH